MGGFDRLQRRQDRGVGGAGFLRFGVDMEQHLLGAGQQTMVAAMVDAVEDVDAFFVSAEHLGGGVDRLQPGDLVDMHDMGFDGIVAKAARVIAGVDAEAAEQRVGAVAEDLEIAALSHVVVVVDPIGLNAGLQGEQWFREIFRSFGRVGLGRMGAAVELFFVGF